MYTLEELIEQIKEPKSKKLFNEIFSIYNQGIYRPVVVMLWTVVVCDIIYKLQYLKYIYNDKIAIEILDIVSKLQEKNKYSSEWEKELLKRIRNNTNLLTNIEFDSLEYIQKQRNLCAHPIITDDSLLNPSKDLTRSLLRSALECILTKHPILSKNFIDLITDDLYERRDDFTFDDEATVKYIESKYLTKITLVQKMKLFKALWKFAFLSSDEKEEATREKNIIILNYLLNKFKESCVAKIMENPDFYTYDNDNEDISHSFYNFIIKNQDLYKILSEHTKLIIKEEYKNFSKIIPCVFLSENFVSHMTKLNISLTNYQNISQEIDDLSIMILYEISKEHNETKLFFDFCISFFCKSYSYERANTLFMILIHPYYNYYDLETLKKLINESSYNNQICGRQRAEIDHRCIADQFVNIGGTLDNIETQEPTWNNFISEKIKEKGNTNV